MKQKYTRFKPCSLTLVKKEELQKRNK